MEAGGALPGTPAADACCLGGPWHRDPQAREREGRPGRPVTPRGAGRERARLPPRCRASTACQWVGRGGLGSRRGVGPPSGPAPPSTHETHLHVGHRAARREERDERLLADLLGQALDEQAARGASSAWGRGRGGHSCRLLLTCTVHLEHARAQQALLLLLLMLRGRRRKAAWAHARGHRGGSLLLVATRLSSPRLCVCGLTNATRRGRRLRWRVLFFMCVCARRSRKTGSGVAWRGVEGRACLSVCGARWRCAAAFQRSLVWRRGCFALGVRGGRLQAGGEPVVPVPTSRAQQCQTLHMPRGHHHLPGSTCSSPRNQKPRRLRPACLPAPSSLHILLPHATTTHPAMFGRQRTNTRLAAGCSAQEEQRAHM